MKSGTETLGSLNFLPFISFSFIIVGNCWNLLAESTSGMKGFKKAAVDLMPCHLPDLMRSHSAMKDKLRCD